MTKRLQATPGLDTRGGGTAITSRDQRVNLGREIEGIASSPLFRKAIVNAQAAKLREQRKALADAHFAAFDEFVAYSRDGKLPTNREDLDRYFALRQRFTGSMAYAVPGAADVHVDKMLTNVLVDQPQGEFIADLAMPLVPVDRRSDLIATLDRSAGMTSAWDVTRQPGEPAKQGSWAYGTSVSYAVVNRAFGFPIPNESIMNADQPYDVARDAMRYAEEIVRLKREKAVATLLTTAATYPAANRLTTTTKWDNADTSNIEPLTDLHSLRDLIRKGCGKAPNVAIMNYPTTLALIRLDDYRDRFKYVTKITDDALLGELAAYLGVEEVLIGMAMENSAAIGQTATFADVWPDDVVLMRREPIGLFTTTLGISPCTDPGTVMRWTNPDPSARAENAAFEMDCDEVIIDSKCGVHIDDVLT